MKTVRLTEACSALGINRQRVQEWLRHGVLTLQTETVAGSATRITAREAFILALMARLTDLGIPRAVAARAAPRARLFESGASFFVVSTGCLAPKIAGFYHPDSPAKVETDRDADVEAMDGPLDSRGMTHALFAWTTIPASELASRLSDDRREAAAVVFVEPLHAAVLTLFNDATE